MLTHFCIFVGSCGVACSAGDTQVICHFINKARLILSVTLHVKLYFIILSLPPSSSLLLYFIILHFLLPPPLLSCISLSFTPPPLLLLYLSFFTFSSLPPSLSLYFIILHFPSLSFCRDKFMEINEVIGSKSIAKLYGRK